MNRRFLTNEGFFYYATLGVRVACLYLSYILEGMIYEGQRPWPSQSLGQSSGPWLLAAVALVCLLNSWFVESLLSHFTRGHPHTGSLRWLRIVLAGVPLLGSLVLPFWLILVDRPADLATRLHPRSPRRWTFLLSPSLTTKIAPLSLATLFIVNLTLLQVVVSWIGAASLRSAGGETALLLLIRALRSTAFLSAAVHEAALYDSAHRLWAAGRSLFVFACFLPWPLFWLAVAPLAMDFLKARRARQVLTAAAFSGRTVLDHRLGESLQLDWWKTSRWREWALPSWLYDSSSFLEEKEKRLNLFRIKAFLLIAEAGALAAFLVWFADQAPILRGPIGLSLTTASTVLTVLAGLALLVLLLSSGLRLLGIEPPVDFSIHPEAQFLLISASAALAGIECGTLLAHGDSAGFGRILLLTGGAGGIGSALVLMVSASGFGRSRPRYERGSYLARFLWMLFLLVLAVVGNSIAQGSPHASAILWLLQGFALLSPVWAVAVGLLAGERLLHPFSFRDAYSLQLPLAPRLVLLFIVVTVCLPLGGFFIPFWILIHQRLWPHLIRLHKAYLPSLFTSTPDSQTGTAAGIRALSPSSAAPGERRTYAFASLAAHLKESGRHHDLFRLVEETTFLADQAGQSSGFRQCADHLVHYALPAAQEEKEWDRFLHYALLVLNFMDLAAALADLRVLETLARNGRIDFALDVVNRLENVGERVVRLAVIAAALDRQCASFRQIVGTAREQLRELPLPADAAEGENQFWQLIVISQRLGPELWPELEALLQQRPFWRSALWVQIGGCFLERGGLDSPELWDALRQMDDPDLVRSALPMLFPGSAPIADPEAIRRRLAELAGSDTSAYWLGCLGLLGRLAESSSDLAMDDWRRWSAGQAIPWCTEMIEAGEEFFHRLGNEELGRLAQDMDEKTAAALWICLLRHGHYGRNGREVAGAARTAIEAIPSGPDRVHWVLELLALESSGTQEERVDGLRAVARELAESGCRDLPLPDLRRCLELVAELRPQVLGQEMENLAWAPDFNLELWVEITKESRCQALLSYLFEHLESLLLASPLAQIEAFRSWTALTIGLASRLCVLRGDLLYLEKAAASSIDQDLLKATVAGDLLEAGSQALARHVLDGITSPESQLVGRLLLQPEAASLDALLAPAPLYQALAKIGPIQGEIFGILALHVLQEDESLFLERCLREISSTDEQLLARLRWTTSLLQEQGEKGLISSQVALERLGQAVGAVESDELLTAIVPELVRLSSYLGAARVSEEIRQAVIHLLSHVSIAWPPRREALERLLTEAPSLLITHGEDSSHAAGPLQVRALFQELVGVLTDVIALPQDVDLCIEILPVLTVVASAFPGPAELDVESLRQAYRKREQATADGLRVLDLCGLDPDARSAELEVLLAQDNLSPRLLEALVYLLVDHVPEQVPEIVQRLPATPDRDQFCRRLVQYARLPPKTAFEVCFQMEDQAARWEAELWLGAQLSAELEYDRWIDDLTVAAAMSGVDPASGRYERLLPMLRGTAPEKSRSELADAVLYCLEKGEHQRGQAALRLWLHAHLSHRQEKPLHVIYDALMASRRALSLPGTPAVREKPAAEPLGRDQGFGKAAAFLWRELHAIG